MESTRLRWAAPVALLALAACRSDKPEDLVKAAFDQMVKAVEAGDAAGATELLDPSFKGPEGLDKPSARLYLMGVLRQGKVGVTVLENRVRLEGREVDQTVGLVLTQKGGGLLPDASRRNYLLRWKARKGDWLLVEVQELGAQP
ncbi:MAG TPA: hypothetical protein VJ600_04950 [Holophagaceae bacterium]|nr:hypothetical protein [Holophagaceae bacterium]